MVSDSGMRGLKNIQIDKIASSVMPSCVRVMHACTYIVDIGAVLLWQPISTFMYIHVHLCMLKIIVLKLVPYMAVKIMHVLISMLYTLGVNKF